MLFGDNNSRFFSLDTIYIYTIKPIYKNSREHENVAFMSSHLYTVICYIEVPFKAGLIVYENQIIYKFGLNCMTKHYKYICLIFINYISYA